MQYGIGAEYENLELVVTYKEIKTIYTITKSAIFFSFFLATEKNVLGQEKKRVGRSGRVVHLRLWYDSETKKKLGRTAVVDCGYS